jgi:chromosomal replication initiator protein
LSLSAHPEFAQAWREIRGELRRLIGESTFEIWLAPIQAQMWDGTVLVLETPPDMRSWVSERYGRMLRDCAERILGVDVRVEFQTTATNGRGAAPHPARRRPGRGADPTADLELRDAFNPRYTFDQFVIGTGNRLAHAGSLAVAEHPGQAYNPLFLHAPPGLGKTHLLHAIGNYVLAFGGGASVRYATVESFTNNFIRALASHSLDRFKHAYRDADVLLIDDVQFLASKAKTEEEFFHTFNAVYETGRQLVLTCDRLPRELLSVEERLRERFESGLVANIAAPDFATRVTILRKRAALDRVPVADGSVLDLIAERVTDNVRALEGALIRVVAHHSLTGHPIDLPLATAVLDEIHPARDRATSVADVQTAVCAHFGLTPEELVSAGRAARLAWPRQLAMYVARELTRSSLPAIGQAFGGRDHATVHYACRRVGERLHHEPEIADTIEALVALVASRHADRSN